MDILKIGSMLAAAVLAACAGAVTLKAAGGTSYYYGQVSSFSPDGRLPYGRTDAAMKREVLDGGSRIRETVTKAPPTPGMQPVETVAEFKRCGKKLVYDVSEANGAFSGTVIFKEPALKSWTYTIKPAKGGEIKGSGSLSEEGIKTEKSLSGAGRPMLVREHLKPVSEGEYLMQVRMMKPAAGME